MSYKRYRNNGPYPMGENRFTNAEEIASLYALQSWSHGLSPTERLSQHHTLASTRRSVASTSPECAPRDRLDLALSSHLRNGRSTFADLTDFYTQPETRDEITWRVLRNEIPAPYTRKYNFNHPLQITGTKERNLSHEVKLDATREHLVLTNPNFHRRSDGGFFRV